MTRLLTRMLSGALLCGVLAAGCAGGVRETTMNISRPRQAGPLEDVKYLVLDLALREGSYCEESELPGDLSEVRDYLRAAVGERLLRDNPRLQLVDAEVWKDSVDAYRRYKSGRAEYRPLFEEPWLTAAGGVRRLAADVLLDLKSGRRPSGETTESYLSMRSEYSLLLLDAEGLGNRPVGSGACRLDARRRNGAETVEVEGSFAMQPEDALRPGAVLSALAGDLSVWLSGSSAGTVPATVTSLSGDAEMEALLTAGAFETARTRASDRLAVLEAGDESRGLWLHDLGMAKMGLGDWTAALQCFQDAHALTGRKESLRAAFQMRELMGSR